MQVGSNQPGWRPRTRSGRSSRLTIRTHIGVRLAVVRLSGVVETIVRSPPCTIYAKSSKTVQPLAYFFSRLQNCPYELILSELENCPLFPSRQSGRGCQPEVRNGGVNYRVRNPIKADPGPNTRQHERGVNKRKQRIRTRKPGAQAKPWGFGPVSKPMIFQLENGRKSQKSKNVRDMRGLGCGDAVHKNEAGI